MSRDRQEPSKIAIHNRMETALHKVNTVLGEIHMHTAAEARRATRELGRSLELAIKAGWASDALQCPGGNGTEPCRYNTEGFCDVCVRERPEAESAQ